MKHTCWIVIADRLLEGTAGILVVASQVPKEFVGDHKTTRVGSISGNEAEYSSARWPLTSAQATMTMTMTDRFAEAKAKARTIVPAVFVKSDQNWF